MIDMGGKKSYMAIMHVLTNPVLRLQPMTLEILLELKGGMVRVCVREVSLAQVTKCKYRQVNQCERPGLAVCACGDSPYNTHALCRQVGIRLVVHASVGH